MNAPQTKHYDFGHTQKLYELLNLPTEQRNESWQDALFEVAADAPLKLAEKQVFRGPDGFLYFVLLIPKAGEEFQPVSLRDALEHTTENGFGCIIVTDEASAATPLYVFSYGDLFALRHNGNIIGDAQDKKEIEDYQSGIRQLSDEPEALLGAPSLELLPHYARNTIGKFMNLFMEIENPGVALIVHAGSVPTRNLVFNIEPTRFKNQEDYIAAVRRMRWFLPRVMGLMDNLVLGEQLKNHYIALLTPQS